MQRIQSFTVNHLKLKQGLYVSRKDKCNGVTATTFDLRFTAPNVMPVMNSAAIHTIEHLGATFLRNSAVKNKVVYFGPMGCKTGFYLVMFGSLKPQNVYGVIVDMLEFIIGYNGDIPGATMIECGNYSEQNLEEAKIYCKDYLRVLTTEKNFIYEN
ncbi:MAG: S-ribosylhomocysteine lyase [Clostridia bacterium]|nr:S-ribosylhomocysteine lyase [Clostridia bacterium]